MPTLGLRSADLQVGLAHQYVVPTFRSAVVSSVVVPTFRSAVVHQYVVPTFRSAVVRHRSPDDDHQFLTNRMAIPTVVR